MMRRSGGRPVHDLQEVANSLYAKGDVDRASRIESALTVMKMQAARQQHSRRARYHPHAHYRDPGARGVLE